LQVGAEADDTGVGRQFPGQQVEERRLAGAVGADDADPIAPLDAAGEIPDDHRVAVSLADRLGLDHQLARHLALGRRQFDGAGGTALLAALLAQGFERPQAAHVAFAPGGDAVAQPVGLHGQFAVELVAVEFLAPQDVVAPAFELGETGVQAPRHAAVQPDGGLRQPFQEAAVVADQHQGGAGPLELGFQPFDGRQVQVVGRFVEQQDIRRRRQYARERRTARLAAGQPRRLLGPRQAQLRQQVLGAVGIVARRQPRLDVGKGRRELRKVRLLGQIAHGGAWLHEPLPGVGLDEAGGDLEQRRLARPVAPDHAQPLALRDGKLGPLQQRRAAKGQVDVAQHEDGRGHGARF